MGGELIILRVSTQVRDIVQSIPYKSKLLSEIMCSYVMD